MDAEIIALITAAGGAIAGGLRWALRLWATVRRETSAAQRADNERMIDALLQQARSNAALGGKIDELTTKLDTLVAWRDRTPVEAITDETSGRRRVQTPPRGYRPPRPGDHND